jgi:hypothetical protein
MHGRDGSFPAVSPAMQRRSDPARISVQPSPATGREPSGIHRKQTDPDAFYVRAHRRGGYCVMIEGKATPISRHDTLRDATMLGETLAKKMNARLIVEE